jgi:prephenate dehydrogenase
MWCELFLDNADYLSNEITILIDNLTAYRDAINADDAKTLRALLAEGDRRKREVEGEL